MREKIYKIIEPDDTGNTASSIYDVFMMAVIIASLIPLAFKQEYPLFVIIDRTATAIFIIDYLLRLWTADLKLKKGALSFIIYPFTPMAIIDLLCILPSLNILSRGFRILKVFRLFRTFRVFRALKLIRYSKNIRIIMNVIRSQRAPLITVGMLAIGYILISALVIFNIEPDTFETFFDAIYWATVSLTTVGYGDIYPVTKAGQVVVMISSFVGIAIVALPAGIVTAGYMNEINNTGENNEENKE